MDFINVFGKTPTIFQNCAYVINRHGYNVYGKKSFLSKESDTLRSYIVYISPTM